MIKTLIFFKWVSLSVVLLSIIGIINAKTFPIVLLNLFGGILNVFNYISISRNLNGRSPTTNA